MEHVQRHHGITLTSKRKKINISTVQWIHKNHQYQKKMSPKIRQWIPSPKYVLTLISYDPKSESGVLKCQFFTISISQYAHVFRVIYF